MNKVIVNGIGAKKVRAGSGIVYRKWVKPLTNIGNGDLVLLLDPKGEHLGCGLWESLGPVALRVIQHGYCDYRSDEEVLEYALSNALKLRYRLGFNEESGFRLVNSDGDLLSGLIIDIYSDVAVIQSSSGALDKHLSFIAELLTKMLNIKHVFNKSTQRSRRDIGLEPKREWIIGRKDRTVIEESGIKFIVDVERGQKTGFFLDQRVNRIRFGRYATSSDKVLDVFSYTGAFGLHALYNGASKAVFIEEDPYAVLVLRENIKINNINMNSIVIYNSSIWNLGEINDKFTLVSVDPPAFIQSPDKVSFEKGVKAYRRAYSWSLGKASDSAIIYLSSCSYFLDRHTFLNIVHDIVYNYSEKYRILGSLVGASPDHVTRGEEYLDYLKGAFVGI